MSHGHHLNEANENDELTEPEKRFLKRVVEKYSRQKNPITRSLVVISLAILIVHLLERSPLPWWIVLPIVYMSSIWLFYQYRRFAIFKTRLMCKMARQLGVTESGEERAES